MTIVGNEQLAFDFPTFSLVKRLIYTAVEGNNSKQDVKQGEISTITLFLSFHDLALWSGTVETVPALHIMSQKNVTYYMRSLLIALGRSYEQKDDFIIEIIDDQLMDLAHNEESYYIMTRDII